MSHREPRPLDPENPQTTYERLPSHHENADVSHVLARVRAFERFFRDHVDGKFPDVYVELHSAAMEMQNADLARYALDLAFSLIALEDEVQARQSRDGSGAGGDAVNAKI
jgi:hypothetical protein